MATEALMLISGLWTRTIDKRIQVLLFINDEWRLVHDEPLSNGADTIVDRIADSAAILKSPPDPICGSEESFQE